MSTASWSSLPTQRPWGTVKWQAWASAAQPMERRFGFQYADRCLDFSFVEYFARHTLCQGVVLRSLLVLAWVFSWRKSS